VCLRTSRGTLSREFSADFHLPSLGIRIFEIGICEPSNFLLPGDSTQKSPMPPTLPYGRASQYPRHKGQDERKLSDKGYVWPIPQRPASTGPTAGAGWGSPRDLQAKLLWRGTSAEKYHYYSLFIVWKQGLFCILVTIQSILPEGEQSQLWGMGSLMVQWGQSNPGEDYCAPIDPLRIPYTIPARGGALQTNKTLICC
jgi:hypothetical protein